METVNKQAILEVLNNLEQIEQGNEGYILVANTKEIHKKLNALGVTSETINKYGDNETFCILALAFSEGYANDYNAFKGGLILVPNSYAVWDSVEGEMKFYDTFVEADIDYQARKEVIMNDDMIGHEKVYILEVQNIAELVEDTERNKHEDPEEKGYDSWLKWNDYTLGEDRKDIKGE